MRNIVNYSILTHCLFITIGGIVSNIGKTGAESVVDSFVKQVNLCVWELTMQWKDGSYDNWMSDETTRDKYNNWLRD